MESAILFTAWIPFRAGIHAAVVSIQPASLRTVVEQPHAVSSVYGGRVK